MQVLCRRSGDMVFARLEGELDHPAAQKVRRALEEAIRDPAVRQMTMDLSGLTFIDSSGIGVLLGRDTTLAARGGWLKVEKAGPGVERIMQMAGLFSVLRRG